MAEYTCRSLECDGRIFDSREDTARCIHCGSEDVRRLDRPWMRPLVLSMAIVLVAGTLGWYGLLLDDSGREMIHDSFDSGCKDITACNYSPAALVGDDSLCNYKALYRKCDGSCLNDRDKDNICDELEVMGCMDVAACNYNRLATERNWSCQFPDVGFKCNGECAADEDGDGVCDDFEIWGCTDTAACNFNAEATEADGSCYYRKAGQKCLQTSQKNLDPTPKKKKERCSDVQYLGVTYKTTELNNQCWFTQNLRAKKTRGSRKIAEHSGPKAKDVAQYFETTFGVIYNYFAVEQQNLCPSTWRIPSRSDWEGILQKPEKKGLSEDQTSQLRSKSFGGTDEFGLEFREFQVKPLSGDVLKFQCKYWISDGFDGFRFAESMKIHPTLFSGYIIEDSHVNTYLGVRCVRNL
jgi:uncharacterized protein (TIGR02145 family)